jgi:hypothetical protein
MSPIYEPCFLQFYNVFTVGKKCTLQFVLPFLFLFFANNLLHVVPFIKVHLLKEITSLQFF